MKNNKGFTLIELLVVIAVIGILAAVVLSSLSSARSKARDVQRISQLREVQKALAMYYSVNGSYPTKAPASGCSATVWDTPLTPLVSGGYIASIPLDPQNASIDNRRYCYNYTSGGSSSYTCNGVDRTEFQYSILFSLENTNPNFPTAGSTGSPVFTHCMVGELK